MKFISVSEAALDSIQRMGEADKARIAVLEATLTGINGMAKQLAGDFPSMARATALIDSVLRVNTNVQPIAKSEN
jgi:hypothetical protein